MRHYFISKEHSMEDYFFFEEKVLEKNFKFKSCSDIFSKNELDYGSLVLIKTILKSKNKLIGKNLDMCCGYGTIGIILSSFLSAKFDMCDINSTAIELAKFNALNNSVDANIFLSDMFLSVKGNYDNIISNPPIKTGKIKLFEFVDGAYSHLNKKGNLILVIKKNLGEESLKKYIIGKFGNCSILSRDKGYYILNAIKE